MSKQQYSGGGTLKSRAGTCAANGLNLAKPNFKK
jgi:hypothetical protein